MSATASSPRLASEVQRREILTRLHIGWCLLRVWTPLIVCRWPLPVLGLLGLATAVSVLTSPVTGGGWFTWVATFTVFAVVSPPAISLAACLVLRRWVYAHESGDTAFLCLHKPWPWQRQHPWKVSMLTSTDSSDSSGASVAVLRYVEDRAVPLQLAATGDLVPRYRRWRFVPQPQGRVARLFGLTIMRREP